uniref:Uncharacterized protein n=1 Tax=Salix viminalis TaxID=40686 RepID=A0A6N2KAA4_SALVM
MKRFLRKIKAFVRLLQNFVVVHLTVCDLPKLVGIQVVSDVRYPCLKHAAFCQIEVHKVVISETVRSFDFDRRSNEDHSTASRFRQVLAERDSLKDQLSDAKRTIADQSVSEKAKKKFEQRIKSKEEKIRQLKHELAMKDEEIRSLKSQQDRREEEYGRLRNNIQSACTDMQNALATLGSAFIFKRPPENGNVDLIGAKSSVGDDMLKYLFKE